MEKRNNRIFVHGVSFPPGIRRLIIRQDTPPLHHAITKIQLLLSSNNGGNTTTQRDRTVFRATDHQPPKPLFRGLVAVADNTVAATIVRELGMFGNEGRDLHLHGVGQQPSSIRVQCRRQGLFG